LESVLFLIFTPNSIAFKLKKSLILKGIVLTSLAGLVFLLSMTVPSATEKKQPFHSLAELDSFRTHRANPIQPGEYFLTPYRCKGCHGKEYEPTVAVRLAGSDPNRLEAYLSATNLVKTSPAQTSYSENRM
jgi:hypothetical protein